MGIPSNTADRFTSQYADGPKAGLLDWPAIRAAAVTPNDSTDLTFVTRSLYVGAAGTVIVGSGGDGHDDLVRGRSGRHVPAAAREARALHRHDRDQPRGPGLKDAMVGIGLGLFESAVRAQKGGAPPGDTTAPGQVTDLSTTGVGFGDALLTWTAAGDDGFTGTAAEYDVRYFTLPINSESRWNAAASFNGAWMPNSVPGGGYAELYILDPGIVPLGSVTYMAVRYRDEAGNMGPISNSLGLQWF
jgi:hypothetical protein